MKDRQVMNGVILRIAAKMLDMAADEFANHGCNDYRLPNTPENLAFVEAMIAASDYPNDEPIFSSDETKIYVMDWQVMGYCARVLRAMCTGLAVESISCGCPNCGHEFETLVTRRNV